MVLAVTIYRLAAKQVSDSMKPVLTLVQLLGAYHNWFVSAHRNLLRI